jgi:hypothetical protein
MSLTSQIKNGGWGALALYLYSLFVLLHWEIPLITSDRIAMASAAAPALLVMFAVVVLNHQLNEFWAGGNLMESATTIREITGGRDFYHSASAEIQSSIDDFDEKAYSHHISILSGIILAIAIPITGYFSIGWKGVVGGVVLSSLLFRTLTIRSYRELNGLATEMSTPYEENYENQ